MKQYTSSQICNIANVTKKTLRHYNKLDLLVPSQIKDNGYWYYNEDSLNKLQLIKNLQTLGFSLIEIKDNIESDFQQLRHIVPEKLQYINEQLIQLDLAKRLLKKIETKSNLKPIDAINASLEEEHIEWYKKNLQPNQFKIVEDMMKNPKSIEDHDKFIQILITLKPHIRKKQNLLILKKINLIKDIFKKYELDDNTIKILIESFLKSNLEGSLSTRILTISEAAYILNLI